jgi:hypothetical protein
MIDRTWDRTRVDRKRALAVFALAAMFSVSCGKHRGYDAPDGGDDESADSGAKTSESRTSAANGGRRAPTGAAGRQSSGAAGRTGSQRGAAGRPAKSGDGGDDKSREPQNAAGMMASGDDGSGDANGPAAEGGSGGQDAMAGESAAGTGAGAAAVGGEMSGASAGAAASGGMTTEAAGADAIGGAGAGGSTEAVGGAGGDIEPVGGAGAGGMSGGDTGGMPAAGGGGAACQRDRDCGEGLLCDTDNSSTCQRCRYDEDCQTSRRYGDGYVCAPDTRLCSSLCASCGGCEEVQTPSTDNHHTDDPIDYPDPPPTSGPHNPCWATWGVHDMPVLDERWVHNLEHGGIVFLYNCPDGCAADVATLSQLVMSHPRTVLTSYPQLPNRFAAVAWGHRLVTSCADAAAFSRFYDENFDHGPESEDAQPDSSCPP